MYPFYDVDARASEWPECLKRSLDRCSLGAPRVKQYKSRKIVEAFETCERIMSNDLECSNDLSGTERLVVKVQCTMNQAADLLHDLSNEYVQGKPIWSDFLPHEIGQLFQVTIDIKWYGQVSVQLYVSFDISINREKIRFPYAMCHSLLLYATFDLRLTQLVLQKDAKTACVQ